MFYEIGSEKVGRTIILRSVCPHIYGMHLVKLAVMLILTGGVVKTESKMRIRGDSHLLLVGDPGMIKSTQCLHVK